MDTVCFSCKKNIAEFPETITFAYRRITFKVFKDGLICKACLEKEYRDLYDALTPRFLRRHGAGVHVHWDRYAKAYRERSEWNREATDLLRLLYAIGVLSYDPANCWDISWNGLSFAPRRYRGSEQLYFTKRKDAEAYAAAILTNTKYKWELRLVADVISEHEILKNLR